MNNSFNEFISEVNTLLKKAVADEKINPKETLQLIFQGESWVSYYASKSPGSETYATNSQLTLLTVLLKNSDTTVSTVANILLKGKYDAQAPTKSLRVMKSDLLKTLSDSELILLKENVRSAFQRLNMYDSITAMKALNKNRVLLDEILLTRPDPKTKLTSLLE
jgi:hypothetical protein